MNGKLSDLAGFLHMFWWCSDGGGKVMKEERSSASRRCFTNTYIPRRLFHSTACCFLLPCDSIPYPFTVGQIFFYIHRHFRHLYAGSSYLLLLLFTKHTGKGQRNEKLPTGKEGHCALEKLN